MSQQLHTASDDPFVTTDDVAGKLHDQIAPALSNLQTEAWPALQKQTSQMHRDVSSAITELSGFREDVFSSLEARVAGWEEKMQTIRAKVDSHHKDSTDLVRILRAELITKSRPAVDPERERFEREDLAAVLGASGHPLQEMLNVARGPNRARAAVVVSGFADGYLEKLYPDQRSRAGIRDALDAALIEGSIAHGSPAEKAYARAAKETLPKVSSWLAAVTVPARARLREAARTRP